MPDKTADDCNEDVQRLVRRLLDDIPTNWLDPLLTGPHAVIDHSKTRFTCRDIERLMLSLKERMTKTAAELSAEQTLNSIDFDKMAERLDARREESARARRRAKPPNRASTTKCG